MELEIEKTDKTPKLAPGNKSRIKPIFEIRGPYTTKDQAKSNQANKFIGQGSNKSSTNAYREAWGPKANCGKYTKDDIIFVSAEGNRWNRIPPDFEELKRATQAGATFITDTPADRNRPYNTGEREIGQFLKSAGYKEDSPGVWKNS